MAYTLIIMRRDRTDVRPLTLHLSWKRLWGLVAMVFLLPILGFWISYTFIAPRVLGFDMKAMQNAKTYAEAQLAPVKAENATLQARLAKLEESSKVDRGLRAEAEVRITQAETARAEAASRADGLEEEVLKLRQSIKFYEELMKPKTDQELVQCFNVNASASGNTVKYSLGLLKNNPNDKTPLDMKLYFTASSGSNAATLSAQKENATSQHSRSLTMVKDASLHGSFTAQLDKEGINMLDIKVRDKKTNKIIASCWKAF